jgi:hypothetical protein
MWPDFFTATMRYGSAIPFTKTITRKRQNKEYAKPITVKKQKPLPGVRRK